MLRTCYRFVLRQDTLLLRDSFEMKDALTNMDYVTKICDKSSWDHRKSITIIEEKFQTCACCLTFALFTNIFLTSNEKVEHCTKTSRSCMK